MTTMRNIASLSRRPVGELMDRQPPFDLQAEIGVLGSIILLPKLLDNVALILKPEDFYDDAHVKVFRHLAALHASGKRIDDTLLTSRLKSAGDFESIGGSAYLSKIVNAVPNAAHATYYAEIVAEKAAYRQQIYDLTAALRDCYDEAKPAAEVASELADRLLTRNRLGAVVQPRPIGEVCRDVVRDLRARIGKVEPPALSSGLEAASRAGLLFAPGEIAIVAARPGIGKTSILTQTGVYQARQGRTVLFASLEMKALTVAQRQLMAAAGINGHSVRKCGADADVVNDLEAACVKFDRLPLLLWDPGRIDVGVIRAMAASVKSSGGLDLLVVDYTSWILAADPKAHRRDQVGDIVKGLRSIAQRFEIPVLLAHQLNRDSDNERPRLSHLRESGCVEEDADVVAFLDPVDVVAGSPAVVNLIVAKNRMGTKGETPLRWFPETTTFADPQEF